MPTMISKKHASNKSQTKKKLDSVAVIRHAAAQMLLRYPYSLAALRKKLLQKGAAKEALEIALQGLCESGLLNERRSIEGQIRYRKEHAPRGRAYVRRELIEKGFPSSLIESVLLQEYTREDEEIVLRRVLEKMPCEFSSCYEEEAKQRQKLILRLAGRGFPLNLIFSLLEEKQFSKEE